MIITSGETHSTPQPSPEPLAGAATDLAGLIDWIRTAAALLPSYSPDPADGSAWLHFDSAVSSLYTALADLDEVSTPDTEHQLIAAT